MKQKISSPYGSLQVYAADAQHGSDDKQRLFVVPGFSEGINHSRQLVDALASEGFDTSTFDQPRRTGKDVLGTAQPIERQSDVVLRVMESTLPQGEKVHAVGHSLGAAALLKAAIAHPELFQSLTLMQPVGMVKGQGFLELMRKNGNKTIKALSTARHGQHEDWNREGRYAAQLDEEKGTRYLSRIALSQLNGGNLLLRNPSLAFKEGLAVSRYDLTDDIAEVARLGIAINVVVANSDELFEPVASDQTYPAIAGSVRSYSSVADAEAGHDTFWQQPKRTAKIIKSLIS